MRRCLVLLLCLALGAGALGSCSEDESADPKALLADAKRQLDATRTVHFDLTNRGLPDGGTVLVSADGSAKRPRSFKGRFRLAAGGVAATLGVVSVGGTLYAKLPFAEDYVAVDPDRLGIADPAELLSPRRGLSSLLTAATRVRSGGRSRVGREVVQEIRARLPARLVGRFLLVADPETSFQTTFAVVTPGNELRRATFRGPFYGKGTTTTYTVVLDRYGEPVDIARPG